MLRVRLRFFVRDARQRVPTFTFPTLPAPNHDGGRVGQRPPWTRGDFRGVQTGRARELHGLAHYVFRISSNFSSRWRGWPVLSSSCGLDYSMQASPAYSCRRPESMTTSRESPLGRGKRRQALGWAEVRELIPTPALRATPPWGGDFCRIRGCDVPP